MQDTLMFNFINKKLRQFFQDENGFTEVPAQSRLSILAACEDPRTIAQFDFDGINYPLPQTGQMWLEFELLKRPQLKGVFCQTTSYRNEPSPIPGRHYKIFPMFEFESHGDINDLKKIERELLEFLGFQNPVSLDYNNTCKKYGITEIKSEHEEKICKEFGTSISLEKFPRSTHPFWNMKQEGDTFNKIDIILYGQETIGSAERSTNIDQMRDCFFTISNGNYAKLLFSKFGKERVIKELDEFLSLQMRPRFGAGIGMTRLARAVELANLYNDKFIPSFKEDGIEFNFV